MWFGTKYRFAVGTLQTFSLRPKVRCFLVLELAALKGNSLQNYWKRLTFSASSLFSFSFYLFLFIKRENERKEQRGRVILFRISPTIHEDTELKLKQKYHKS